jgi:hypothetical protein
LTLAKHGRLSSHPYRGHFTAPPCYAGIAHHYTLEKASHIRVLFLTAGRSSGKRCRSPDHIVIPSFPVPLARNAGLWKEKKLNSQMQTAVIRSRYYPLFEAVQAYCQWREQRAQN